MNKHRKPFLYFEQINVFVEASQLRLLVCREYLLWDGFFYLAIIKLWDFETKSTLKKLIKFLYFTLDRFPRSNKKNKHSIFFLL